ncbi:MAG: hypothetical protein KY447_09795 [Actinobacteria bacterium]|nr:hypothetical protein [Actinomycetota bacterium]
MQLQGSERRLVELFAGFYARPPGDTGFFAIDLVPGQRYAMIYTLLARKRRAALEEGHG